MRSDSAKAPRFTVGFDFYGPVQQPECTGDAWLAALMIPAMFAGESLEIQAPVTRRLARNAREIQRVFHAWYPELLKEIDLVTPEVRPTAAHDDDGCKAAFFSGGVDSWYSLDRHRHELSAIVTVKGFDIPSADETIWPQLKRANAEIASELGLRLINVETNIRDLVDPGMGCFKRRYEGDDFWGSSYHGACLAAVALFLQQDFSTVFIPASWQYNRLQPWGSHPLLECLWSNGRLDLVHDGAEAPRMERMARVVQIETALRHLRVCPDYTHGAYNCGECEKCRRTMLTLRLFGTDLTKLPFARPLDLRELEMNPPKPCLRPLYRELLDLALSKGDSELVRCLRIMTGDSRSARYEWHKLISRMQRSAKKRIAWLRS